jgi:O-antigen ligase
LLGPYRWPDWQFDLYIRIAFVVVQAAVIAVASRRFSVRDLAREPFLLGYLAIAWASTIWSVEPGVTMWRALMLIGTTGVGWYLGERFTVRQLGIVVAAAGAVGTAGCLIALAVVPKLAMMTGTLYEWSGVYVNRNVLGWVLSAGALATVFVALQAKRRARVFLGVLVLIELLLVLKSGNRTGPGALGGATVVCVIVYVVRRYAKGKLVAFWASILSLGAIFIGFGVVEWQWKRILVFAGRTITLSHRNVIWAVDRSFIAQHPWGGLGFEAVWTNRFTVAVASDLYGKFPYEAHSGYYEVAIGVGMIGLAILGIFLVLTLYRAFLYAWKGRDIGSLWPLAFLLFVLAANFTESLFVSSEALWAVLVGIAFALDRRTTILVRRSNK